MCATNSRGLTCREESDIIGQYGNCIYRESLIGSELYFDTSAVFKIGFCVTIL